MCCVSGLAILAGALRPSSSSEMEADLLVSRHGFGARTFLGLCLLFLSAWELGHELRASSLGLNWMFLASLQVRGQAIFAIFAAMWQQAADRYLYTSWLVGLAPATCLMRWFSWTPCAGRIVINLASPCALCRGLGLCTFAWPDTMDTCPEQLTPWKHEGPVKNSWAVLPGFDVRYRRLQPSEIEAKQAVRRE